MTIETTEKRANPRAQYFLVRKLDDYIPFFAFRSENEPTAIAALVTDLSEGGIQILSTISTVLDQEQYQLTLVSGPQSAATPLYSGAVRKEWSRPEGMYIQTGFSFTEPTPATSDLVAHIKSSEHQVLRCVLAPQG